MSVVQEYIYQLKFLHMSVIQCFYQLKFLAWVSFSFPHMFWRARRKEERMKESLALMNSLIRKVQLLVHHYGQNFQILSKSQVR